MEKGAELVVQIPNVRKSTFGGDDANVLWSSGIAHQAYVGEHARQIHRHRFVADDAVALVRAQMDEGACLTHAVRNRLWLASEWLERPIRV